MTVSEHPVWKAALTPPPVPKAFVFDYGGVLAADGYSAPLPEAIEVVTILAGRGLPLVLASNTAPTQPIDVRAAQLAEAGLLEHFPVLLASQALGFAKPDPRFFHAVRDALAGLVPDAAAHEVTWVEDSDRRGIAPALQYGWNALWVGGDRDDRLAAVPGVQVIATIADLPRAVGLSR
jgi:FMN phosphatase YigB (HAD superfamily)